MLPDVLAPVKACRAPCADTHGPGGQVAQTACMACWPSPVCSYENPGAAAAAVVGNAADATAWSVHGTTWHKNTWQRIASLINLPHHQIVHMPRSCLEVVCVHIFSLSAAERLCLCLR